MLNLDKSPDACLGMDDIRGAIDTIDREVVRLLGQRYRYVQAAAAFKSGEDKVRAPSRFQEVMEKRREWAQAEGLDADVIEKLYRDLVNYFIAREMEHWRKESL